MSIKKYGVITLSILCLLGVGVAWASPSQSSKIVSQVFGNGGMRLEYEPYSLHYTLGQPVVGKARGLNVALCAGFWCTSDQIATADFYLHLPLVLRNLP